MTISKLEMLLASGRAIKVGDLWVPSDQLEQSLSTYCRSLFLLTNIDQHPYQFAGSVTLISFRDRLISLFTKHQISNDTDIEKLDDINRIVIPFEGGEKLLSGDRYSFINEHENGEEEVSDLRVMDLTVHKRKISNFSANFFLHQNKILSLPNNATFLAFGMPFSKRNIDLDETGALVHIHETMISLTCNYIQPSLNAKCLHVLGITSDIDFEVNGISGGPIFIILPTENGNEIRLFGIIVRANRNYIHAVDLNFLTKYS